jgi:gliding motility-associated-like protein
MSKLLRGTILFFSFLFVGFNLTAQDEYAISNGTATTCNGTFTDDGTENPYSGSSYTYTLCPDTPGDVVQIAFSNFSLQLSVNPNNSDKLIIYQGTNTTFPQVGAYTGTDLQGLTITGNTSNVSGCLTFQFISPTGNSAQFPGWVGVISCTTPCDEPIQNSNFISPAPPVAGLDSISVCIGDPVEISGAGSNAAPGFTIGAYIWNFDDGTVDNASGVNASHIYQEAGEFIVSLTIEDNNGCQSLNLSPLKVIVSTLPDIQIIHPDTICLGETAQFITAVDGITWTALPPLVVSGETYLADDLGFDFNSSLTFDFFEPGATLDDCNDLEEIFINMEHSYLGDLEMIITCPDNTSVTLHNFGSGGGGTFLGEAVDPGNGPGIGYDYGWSPTSTLGFLYQAGNQSAVTYVNNVGANVTANIVNPGIYESQEDLCDLVGCPLNGTWTFTVTDNLGIDDGYIFAWGINFNPDLFPGITTFTPIWGQEADSSYWSTSANNVVFTSPDANTIHVAPSEPGSFQYTFTTSNDFGCSFDTTITLVVTEPFEFEAWPDQEIACEAVTPLGVELVGSPPPPPTCDYSLVLTDTWGDGWGGGSLELVIGGVSNNYTLNVGISQTFPLPGLANGTLIEISYTPGTSANENEYILYDGNGDIVFNDGEFGTTPMTGLAYNGTVDCSPPGADFVYSWSPAGPLNNANIQYPLASGLTASAWFYVSAWEAGHPDCAVVDSMYLDLSGALTAGPDIPGCAMSYTMLAQAVGIGQWSAPAGSGISFANINSANTIVSATTPGTYTLTWIDTEGLSCPNTDDINVTFFNGIVMTPTITEPLCFGECSGEIQVTGTGGIIAPASNYTYTFSSGNAGPAAGTREDLCFGNIIVTLTDNQDCSSTETFFIDQPPAPLIDSIYTEREECAGFCNGIAIVYSEVAEFYSFDGGDTFQAEAMSEELCSGMHNVIIQDANGCMGNENILIPSPTAPLANFAAEPPYTSLFDPQISFINFSDGNLVNEWSFGYPLVLGTSDEDEPFFNFPTNPGIYVVQLVITDSIGCTDTLKKEIEILDELQIFIPTAFSPNDDGINDYLEVMVQDLDPANYTFQVYDRWGSKVFETKQYPTRWNGQGITTEDYFVTDGVYVWTISAASITTTKKIELQGMITVIR